MRPGRNAFFVLALFFFAVQLPASIRLMKGVNLGGNLGVYFENYSMKGKERRRPPNTFRIRFTPSISFLGMTFGINTDFFYTSEGEQRIVTQPINRISLNPAWNWGKVYLGNFSPKFSDLILQGVTLRGGGLDLHPGIFRLFLVGGRSRRECEDSIGRSFRRYLYGIRVGIGKKIRTALSLIKVRDDPHSIENPGDLLPQENLVSAFGFVLSFLKRKFNLEGEAAASVHTRDLNSPELDTAKVPGIVKSLMKPRRSTRVDFAYKLRAKLRVWLAKFDLSYKYVGPGFTSLGLASSHNDHRKYRGKVSFAPAKGLRFELAYEGKRNNLLGDKLATAKSRSYSGRFRYSRPGPVAFNIAYHEARVRNESEDSLRSSFERVSSLRFDPAFAISYWKQQTLRLGIAAERSVKEDAADTSETCSIKFSTGYSLQVTKDFTPSLGIHFMQTSTDGGKSRFIYYTLGAGLRVSKAGLNAALSYAPLEGGSDIKFSLRGSYKLGRFGSLRAAWRLRRYSSENSSDYTESRMSLSYSVVL